MSETRSTSNYPALYALVPEPFQACLALSLVVFGYVLYCHCWAAPPQDGAAFLGVTHYVLVDGWIAGLMHPDVQTFAIQTALLLLVGAAAISLPFVRQAIELVADLGAGGDGARAAGVVAAAAIATGWIHPGVSILLSATLVRRIIILHARRPEEGKPPLHFGLLAVAGYCGLLVCQGGLGGWISQTIPAPRPAVTSGATDARGLTPIEPQSSPQPSERLEDARWRRLESLLFSPRFLIAQASLFVVIPMGLALMTYACRAAGYSSSPPELWEPGEGEDSGGYFGWLLPPGVAYASSLAFAIPLSAITLLACVWLGMSGQPWQASQLALVVFSLIIVGLVFSAPNAQQDQVRETAGGSVPMFLQMPLYGGIAGMLLMAISAQPNLKPVCGSLVDHLDAGILALSWHPAEDRALATLIAASLTNLIAPCDGGLRMMQALPPAASSSEVLAVLWGTQVSSLLQPMWLIAGLGITRAQPREVWLCALPVSLLALIVYVLCLVLVS
jgi:short subunit fatty acids transporter